MELLTGVGLKVEVANNGFEALDKACGGGFDLVLMASHRARAISSGAPGGNGGDTTLGGYRAVGGGGGGGYSADASASRGRDGGSSGGAASFAALHGPGAPRLGQGFQGGFCDPGSNNGAGAGGGCTTPGANGVGVNGGLGGLGWTTDVPGDPRDVCGGGPGGQFSGARSAASPSTSSPAQARSPNTVPCERRSHPSLSRSRRHPCPTRCGRG